MNKICQTQGKTSQQWPMNAELLYCNALSDDLGCR